MTKVKVKDSLISDDWGILVEKTANTIKVDWNGKIGIYTIAKNEITYGE
jgi:hypothetical protein